MYVYQGQIGFIPTLKYLFENIQYKYFTIDRKGISAVQGQVPAQSSSTSTRKPDVTQSGNSQTKPKGNDDRKNGGQNGRS